MSNQKKHPVLLVDDEPDVLFSLKGLLRHEFELHTAESGEEAIEILSNHSIHVIMTDQRMPGMTGVELMAHAKASCPDAIRIVFTGFADIKAVVEAINTGGLYRYITKPWDPDELIEVLHHAARRYEDDKARAQLGNDINSFTDDVENFTKSVKTGDEQSSAKIVEQGRDLAARAKALL